MITDPVTREMMTYRRKNVEKFIRAVDRWNAKCARMSVARTNRLENPNDPAAAAEYDAAFEAWNKGMRNAPGKTAKHHAYGDAYMLTLMMADHGIIVPRAESVDGLRRVADAAKTLAGA